jgi:hypothetical protein
MSEIEIYEVFAIRYGTVDGRVRRDNFIMTDDHDLPMPLDYFVWAIVNDGRDRRRRREGRERGRYPPAL